ncbi:MAG TPA: hypothetical protein VE869_02880, partial [Gemmatimonas sp.]|nr:hypothetical protein [Gemmatimonas sp.]
MNRVQRSADAGAAANIPLDPVIATAFHVRVFEDALTLEEGASPRTIDAYRRDVVRCAAFMRAQGIH